MTRNSLQSSNYDEYNQYRFYTKEANLNNYIIKYEKSKMMQ